MRKIDFGASKNCIVVIGDSRKMDELPNESVQLVVTSPPYPMIDMWDDLFSQLKPVIRVKLSANNSEDAKVACRLMHNVLAENIQECSRVLSEGGICCINIGDAVRTFGGEFQLFPNHSIMLDTLAGCGLTILPYILWKKPTNKPNAFLGSGFLPTNAYVTIDCEYILIARKGKRRQFKPKDPARYRSQFTKKERDKWFSQIWSDIPGTNQMSNYLSKRSGAFPIEIPRRLIRMFSIEGDTILDPFMGTGTSLLAALELNRRFVGYEIDEKVISEPAMLRIKDSGQLLRTKRS